VVSIVGAVRQTKYSWLGKAHRGRATDYDVTEHRLTTYINRLANEARDCMTELRRSKVSK